MNRAAVLTPVTTRAMQGGIVEAAENQALLLLPVGNRPVTVVHVGQRGVVLRSPAAVDLEPRVRVGFLHRGEHPGKIRLLGQVERHETTDAGIMIALRPLVLHTGDGRECLAEFLVRFLKQEPPRDDRYEDGAGGLFYHLDAESVPAPRAGQRAKPSTYVRQLTTVRVPVRVNIAYLLERMPDKIHDGVAYNVTDHGLYVSTDAVLPAQGDVVRLIYPVALHAKPIKLKLTGEVYWTTGATASGGGGGFAVHLVLPDDDPSTRPWREYVEREIAYKG